MPYTDSKFSSLNPNASMKIALVIRPFLIALPSVSLEDISGSARIMQIAATHRSSVDATASPIRKVFNNCSGYISLKDITSDKIMDPSKASLDESLPSYSYENLDISHPRSQMITPNKFRHVKHEAICWAHQGNPDQININPGSVQALDICKVQRYKDNGWYLIFPTERGWRNVRLRMEFKTDVYGRLFLCPSNEFPTITDFKIIMQDGVPTLKIIKPNFFQRIKLRITRRRVLMSD